MFSKVEKKNAIWNSGTFIFMSLIGFITFSINVKSFNFEMYGLYILISSIFIIGNNFDFGFGMSTIKHVSEFNKLQDFITLNKIFVSYFFIYLVMGLAVSLIFVAYFYLFFLKSGSIINNCGVNINLLFVILNISFFVRYIGNYLKNILEGFAEFIMLNKILITSSIINLSAVLIVYLFGLTLIHLSLFILISNLLFFIFLIVNIKIHMKMLKFNLEFFSLHLIKKHFTYGLNIQISFFVAGFVEPLVKYLFGSMLSLSYVTYFEIGKKIIDLTNGIIASAQKGILNILSEENAVGRLTEFINEKLYAYSKMSNYYSIVLYGILNPFICLFALHWFKSAEAMIMLLIFMLPYSLINFAGCAQMVIIVEGRGFKLLVQQVINLLLISGLTYLTVVFSRNYFGMIGYYAATVVNVTLILVFLKIFNSFRIKEYLLRIKVKDIIILNTLILLQLYFIIFYEGYLNYIFIISFLVYLVVFHRYLIFLFDKIRLQIKLYFAK